MDHTILNLKQAAEHIHLDLNELRHCAQRGEISAQKRGDEWYFGHRELDEWAQRNLLAANERELAAQHRTMMAEDRRADRQGWGVANFFLEDSVELVLDAKTKSGVLRDMTDLADRSGRLYDPDSLFRELVDREEIASTAVGRGIALLHPRFHDPYIFESSFIAYGRATHEIFFGAPDGETTRHFFLICSTDHEAHLHMLARLAMLAHGSELVALLDAAESPNAVIEAIRACEAEYC